MWERQFRRTCGGVCSLGLLLVWCSKYRRGVFGGRVRARCGELLEQIAAESTTGGFVAREVMADHVQLFVRVGATDASAAVVRPLKGCAAWLLGSEFAYLRRMAKALWSPSYFAASVGCLWESTVRRCIEYQWDGVA